MLGSTYANLINKSERTGRERVGEREGRKTAYVCETERKTGLHSERHGARENNGERIIESQGILGIICLFRILSQAQSMLMWVQPGLYPVKPP